MIYNFDIYDPDMGKVYEMGYSANNHADALEQAKSHVEPWGHSVRGYAGTPKVEGRRDADRLWKY